MRKRSSNQISEDIFRIIWAGGNAFVGGVIHTENIVQNTIAEVLDNVAYVGINGFSMIAQPAFSAKRSVEDVCSFFYRFFSGKEQLRPFKELDSFNKEITSDLKELLKNETISKDIQGSVFYIDSKPYMVRNNELVTGIKPIEAETQKSTTIMFSSTSADQIIPGLGNKIKDHLEKKGIKLTNTIKLPLSINKDAAKLKIALKDFECYLPTNNGVINYINFNLLEKSVYNKYTGYTLNEESINLTEYLSDSRTNIQIVDEKLSHGDIESQTSKANNQFTIDEITSSIENLKKYSEYLNNRNKLAEEMASKLKEISSSVDDNLKTKIDNLNHDIESFNTSLTTEQKRLVTDEYLSKRTIVEIPKTSFGKHLISAAADEVGEAIERLKGESDKRPDKSKGLYSEALRRDRENQEKTFTRNPIGKFTETVSKSVKSLAGKEK